VHATSLPKVRDSSKKAERLIMLSLDWTLKKLLSGDSSWNYRRSSVSGRRSRLFSLNSQGELIAALLERHI
jgi:hypothetical protein